MLRALKQFPLKGALGPALVRARPAQNAVIGKRLRADQKRSGHSVETKIDAARVGLQDSIQSGVSLLEEGVSEVRAVAETPEVGEAVKSVQLSMAKNPESKHLFDESEKMFQKASDFVEGSVDAALKNIPGQSHAEILLEGQGRDAGL